MIDPQQKFSDETIRRFLLGTLSGTEQTAFEQSLLTDDGLEERVRLAELELSDDYAAGRLSQPERDLFGAGFLLTDDRQRQLKVSGALQEKLSFPLPAPVRESLLRRAVNVFDVRRHAWKYAFAALILMLLLGTALLVKKDRSRLTGVPFIPHHAVPTPTGVAPQPMHHPPSSSAPTHTDQPPALPLHEDSTPSEVLNSKTPLQNAPVIRTNGDVVTLELKLEGPLADFYGVNIMTMAGESVFVENMIKRTEPETVKFDVPADAIDSGDFQITLIRVESDSKTTAGTYYFRVR